MRLQKPQHDNTIHVIVWDPVSKKWIPAHDNPLKNIALRIVKLEREISVGSDYCEISGDPNNLMPLLVSPRVALVDLHNLLRIAFNKWFERCRKQ